MQPTQKPDPDSSGNISSGDSTGAQPDTTFQPVVISPTEPAASEVAKPDTPGQSVAEPVGSLSSVTPDASEPRSTAIPVNGGVGVGTQKDAGGIQPIASAGATPASLNDAQSQTRPQPNPVPSLAVPQRGSFSAPVPDQSAPSVTPQVPVTPSPASAFPQPVVSDQASSFGTVAQPAVVAGGMEPTPRRSRKGLFLGVGGGVAVLLALFAAGFFGWYLPNTPANVYSTGLDRSGKALDGLVTAATEQKQLEAYSTSVIKGSAVAKMDGSTYSGDFTTSFDKTAMNGGLNVSLKAQGSSEKKLSLKALSKLPADSTYPDIYLQFTGIKDLGVDALLPGLSEYDGKWISIGSDYLESLGSSYGVAGGDNTKAQVTAADIAEVARAGMTVTQDYVFTSDPEKAVLVKKEFVGKEKLDGMDTYHYKVGIHTEHAKDYCVALGNAVLSTDAAKKFAEQSDTKIADLKKNVAKNCADDVKDSIKSSDTFDMWVDGKYKLIHMLRFYDKEDVKSYFDVGQTYLGGDKLSFFFNAHDDKDKLDGKFTLDTDIHAAKTSGVLTLKSSGEEKYDVTVKLNAEASTQAVPFTKPSGAVPIQDILKKFGLSPQTADTGSSAPSNSNVQSKAADTERQTDINSIYSYLEAYHAGTGRYPTLAQLNSASWRATTVKGLDDALTPPGSTVTTLASQASASQYGYVPTACGSDGCKEFTVSALLSTGQVYAKQSISASDKNET